MDANTTLTGRFDDALDFAHALHRDQTRKGKRVPYIAHLMAVAATVLDHGGDEEAAIAALLHDAIEDQGGMRAHATIRARFGAGVAGAVLALSDATVTPKPPWHERKAAYVAHLRGTSPAVKLVAAADKLHNLRCTVADVREHGPVAMEKFNAPPVAIVAYYDACLGAVRADVPRALAAEIERALDDLRALLADVSNSRR
jgi:(p)ppGpp synthase/HD superfamily hydrolase